MWMINMGLDFVDTNFMGAFLTLESYQCRSQAQTKWLNIVLDLDNHY